MWISSDASSSCALIRSRTGAGTRSMMESSRPYVASPHPHRFLFILRARFGLWLLLIMSGTRVMWPQLGRSVSVSILGTFRESAALFPGDSLSSYRRTSLWILSPPVFRHCHFIALHVYGMHWPLHVSCVQFVFVVSSERMISRRNQPDNYLIWDVFVAFQQ
jgi:hypothetical protein